MQRIALLLTAPLLLCVALAGCSSSSPADPSANAAKTAAAGTAASPSAADTDTADDSSTGGSGSITFSGKVSGTMTISACESGIAQLAVLITGDTSSYTGIIDKDDFTFVDGSAGYTIDKAAAKPAVSNGGKTFTVKDTKLVGIVSDDSVTASGSVTCP